MYSLQLLQKVSQQWRSATLAAISFSMIIFNPLPIFAASLTPVRTELSLLIDTSGSIDTQEYRLQMQGYESAWTAIAPKFETGNFGAIAVNVIAWSGSQQQQEVIPWTLIDSQASALQFAQQMGSLSRLFSGSTAPGSALNFAVPLFSSNSYQGDRWVIDVSGDGRQNDGFSTALARDNALANGVTTINGLPILGESGLESWYATNLMGGEGAFVEPAQNFADFDRAITHKLDRELEGAAVPEPSSMAGLLLAGTVGAWVKRRRGRTTPKA